MGGVGNGVERSRGRLGGDALVELVLVRAGGFEVWALGSDRGRLAIGVPSGGLSRGGGSVSMSSGGQSVSMPSLPVSVGVVVVVMVVVVLWLWLSRFFLTCHPFS